MGGSIAPGTKSPSFGAVPGIWTFQECRGEEKKESVATTIIEIKGININMRGVGRSAGSTAGSHQSRFVDVSNTDLDDTRVWICIVCFSLDLVPRLIAFSRASRFGGEGDRAAAYMRNYLERDGPEWMSNNCELYQPHGGLFLLLLLLLLLAVFSM